MMTDDQFIGVINSIVARQLQALQAKAEEEGDQAFDDLEERLMDAIKEELRKSLENLWTLFDEYIDTENCTLGTALEFIPWFSVYGLWLGAQLGVAQDEYYAIVDYHLKKSNLIEE